MIFIAIGITTWITVLVGEADNYEEDWFFKSRQKRKIACLILGPGAWVVELIRVLIIKTCDLISPLCKWLQTGDDE